MPPTHVCDLFAGYWPPTGVTLDPPMRHTRRTHVLGILAVALSSAVTFGDGAPTTLRPGVLGGGVTLLPNGWKIAPAGIHRQIGDLPLAMVESADGRSLLVTTNGYARP